VIDLSGKRVGIVMLSAIGDAVHVLPVTNALKRHAPDCHLTWILQPLTASLIRGHPTVDELVEFNPYRGWRGWLELRSALRARPFDLVIDLQVAFKGGVVTALTRSPLKLGFDRARARDLNWLFTTARISPHPPQHVQDQYFEFLGLLGVSPEPVEWELGPWPGEPDPLRGVELPPGREIVAIQLATSDPDKDWLPERWATVIERLVEEHGLAPVLIGGRSQRELAARKVVDETARHRPASTLGNRLREMVGVIDRAALVLSLDSAPMHMAVALERPVISLMGATDPRRVGPYRRFQDLVVDAYHEPGEVIGISAARRRGRMARIGVEDVMEKVRVWERMYRGRVG
jgi:heptosyltransferase I